MNQRTLPRTLRLASGLIALLLWSGWTQAAQSQASVPYPVISGKVYKFERIAAGVYYVPSHGFGSNDVVIVNDHDVVLVDTGDTPAATRILLADIKVVTDKPVRYVINTHWHFDHTDGNSVFGPEVLIIAHEFVRQAIESFDVLHREPYASMGAPAVAERVADLRRQLAAAGADQQAALRQKLEESERLEQAYAEVRPTPPNLTYTGKLTLYRGHRQIDLLFLGRGHTGGDTVVWLPRERIVCSGDLMETSVPYMGDAYFDEWIQSLAALKRIDFAVDLPGHGVPFTDKSLITALQSYIADFIAQGRKLRAQGVSAQAAAGRIDLTAYAGSFPRIKGPGVPLLAVKRLYEWLGDHPTAPAAGARP